MDDLLAGRQSVERHLREQMVLGLVLHAAHQQQPEQILVSVVAAGADLVIDEAHLRVLFEPDFFLMVSNKNKSRIESCDKFANNPVDDVGSEIVEAGIV